MGESAMGIEVPYIEELQLQKIKAFQKLHDKGEKLNDKKIKEIENRIEEEFKIKGLDWSSTRQDFEKLDLEKLEIDLEDNRTLKETYDMIVDTLKYYLDLNPKYYNIVALWIIGTYVNQSFSVFPYLFLNAMRGSGKTRLLKLITALADKGQLMASMTEAVLFRTTGTLAIDEFENIGSKDKNELRELLNAAYKKGIKIVRMRKKKGLEGEQQVAEEFEVFRPIVMANIWGMEEVLGDRCINLQIEKSSNSRITRLVENFDEFEPIKHIKSYFSKFQCRLCRVVCPRNIHSAWNDYIDTIDINNTNNTTNTTDTLEEALFKRIAETEIDGRNLELFFPLFLIAKAVSEEILTETLDFACSFVKDKRTEEMSESKDVMVYRLVAGLDKEGYIKLSEIVNTMRFMTNEGEMEWLNALWMGRALKRLNLIVDKRRRADGREVILDRVKAKDKLKMFE